MDTKETTFIEFGEEAAGCSSWWTISFFLEETRFRQGKKEHS